MRTSCPPLVKIDSPLKSMDLGAASFDLEPDGLEVGRFGAVDREIGRLRDVLPRYNPAAGLCQGAVDGMEKFLRLEGGGVA